MSIQKEYSVNEKLQEMLRKSSKLYYEVNTTVLEHKKGMSAYTEYLKKLNELETEVEKTFYCIFRNRYNDISFSSFVDNKCLETQEKIFILEFLLKMKGKYDEKTLIEFEKLKYIPGEKYSIGACITIYNEIEKAKSKCINMIQIIHLGD